MTFVNKSEIARQIASAEGLSGAALESRAKTLESLSEKALNEKLQSTLNGSAQKSEELESDGWDYLGVEVEGKKSLPEKDFGLLQPLSYEESKDLALNSLFQDTETGMKLLTNTDNGAVSKLYESWKQCEGSFLSLPSTVRAIHLQEKSNLILEEARAGRLTKNSYYEMLKGTLLEIYPSVESKSDEEKQELAEKIGTLSPSKLKRWQDNVLRLPREGTERYADAVREFENLFEMETTDEETKIVKNGDGQTLLNETKRLPKPQYELKSGTGDEILTFEQAYRLERGIEFSQEKVTEFSEKSMIYQLVESKGRELDEIKSALKSPLALVKGNSQSAVPPEVIERSNQQLETALYSSLASLYGDDEKALNKGLQDLSGFEGLVFENGRLKNKVKSPNPLFGENMPVPYAQAAENVIKSLDKNYNALLNGKSREQYAEEYARSYAEAYGKNNASKLARAYINDQQEAVQSIRSGVEYLGAGLMVGGMLVFPPAALVGGGISTFGGAGIELLDESTKKRPDSEKIDELKKEMFTNGLLMGVGMGASKVGQAIFARAANSSMLAISAATVADYGVDIAISLVGDLALTGQISLEGEGFSQAMALIAGHKNKIVKYVRKGAHSAMNFASSAISPRKTAYISRMSKFTDSSGKPVFSDFALKQMAKTYGEKNLDKIPRIYEKVMEKTDNIEVFNEAISNPAIAKSKNLKLLEDILNVNDENASAGEFKRLFASINEKNVEYYETIVDAVKKRGNDSEIYRIMQAADWVNKENFPALKKALEAKSPDGNYKLFISDIPYFCKQNYKIYGSDKLSEETKDFLLCRHLATEEICTAIEVCPKDSKFIKELNSANSDDFDVKKLEKLAIEAIEEDVLRIAPDKKLKNKLNTYFNDEAVNKRISSVEIHDYLTGIDQISDPTLKISARRNFDAAIDGILLNSGKDFGANLTEINEMIKLDEILSGKRPADGTVEEYFEKLRQNNPQKAQKMLNLLENSAPQHKSRFQKIKEKLFGTKTQNLEDLEISDVEMRDLKFDKEFAPIKEWIANCSDPKAAARMYETKYLSRLSPAAREIAAKIDKDFGTKVFMSDTNNPESLQLIYNELLEWKKAGKQDVKFPKVIDCTKIDELYVNSTSVAYHQHDGKKLSFSSSESDEILFALRHEMMHENDSYIDFDFGVWNRVNSEYIIKNKKYYDEIQYGLAANDINPAHADYAYTNRKEFLAVAAEGDYSVYSDEFKDVLVKLGMPQWVLKMQNKQNIGTKTQIYSHPEYSKKYNDLQNARISASARNMYVEAVNSIDGVKKDYSEIFTSVQDAKFMSRVKDMDKVFEKHYRRLESFDKQIKKVIKSGELTSEEIAAGKKPRTSEQINAEIARLQALKEEALNDLQKIRDDIQDTIGARIVMDDCSELATDKVVYDLINAIDEGKIEVLSLENYCGDGLKPYFSSTQIKKIRMHCRAKGYDPVITSVVNRSTTAKMDYEAVFNSKDALKPSGYTTAQLNIKHKNGAISELQIRGKAINELAESEHIIYDFKEGKDLIGENPQKSKLLGDVEKAVADIYKAGNENKQKAYSAYLTQCYEYARKSELNEPAQKPVLPAGIDPSLDMDNIIRIHKELGKLK